MALLGAGVVEGEAWEEREGVIRVGSIILGSDTSDESEMGGDKGSVGAGDRV